ncbi:MAG: gliding motility-associated C-terminal domain-containing protein, partial [Bacteroidales bacterium]|nr:gliding motility-associated C-terminal domain-containing protein [Bacteroidales bacterium]
ANVSNATLSNLLPGKYEFSWTLEKGACPSSIDNLIITVSEPPDIAVAAADFTVCSANSATLIANDPIVGNGVWSLVGGATNSPTIISYNSPTTTVNNLTSGTYQFRWTITSDSDCFEQTDDIIIQVSAPAVADPDRNLCNVTASFLEGTEGSDGTWTLSPLNTGAPAPAIANNSFHTADVTGMALDQSYIFRYTIPLIFGCGSTFDDLTINTSAYGSAPDAGPDQEICTTGGNSVIMAANNPVSGTGSWNQFSGPNSANIVNQGLNTTEINNLIAGIYIFGWNVDYNFCGNYSDVVKIIVNEPPTLSDAGTDQINACQLDAQLAGNLPAVGIGTWTLFSAPSLNAASNVIIDNPNLPNSTISNITDLGNYEFTWTTTNGSVCASNATNVIVTFTADPPSVPNAGIDQFLCDANSFTLAGNDPGIGTGTWSQISGPVGALITNPGIYNTSVTNTISGTYQFQWEINNGGCTLSDIVNFVNSAIPPIADASLTDQEICEFNTLLLVGNDPGPGNGSWSFVSGPTVPLIISPSNQNSDVTGATAGAYTFKWTLSNGTCPITEDNITVDIINNPTTDLSVSGDEVCDGSDALVTVFSTENLVNYKFYIEGNQVGTLTGDGSDLVINISNTNLIPGKNYVNVTATNANNCSVSLDNQAIIIVNENPSTSNAISDDEVCENEDAVITISNSQNGVNYDAFKGVDLVGSGTGNGGNLDITILTDGTWVTTSTITITATSLSTSCVSDLSNQSTVTVNANPLADRNVIGDTTCLGLNGTVTINASETGVNYEAFIGTTSVGLGAGNGGNLEVSINAGDLVTGTNTIDLMATNVSSSCAVNLSDLATLLVVDPPLLDRGISGDTVCENADASITIISSENGVTYDFYKDVNLVTTINGNGGDISIIIDNSWLITGANTFAIAASNVGCTQNLTNQSVVNVNRNPDAALNISGSTVCDNADGAITISTSENGIDYEVFAGNQSVSIGTGDGNNLIMNVLSADLSIGADTFQIVATNPGTGCFVNMDSQAIITVNANPDLTLGLSANSTCDGSDGLVTILNSESGTSYEAFIGANAVASATGNGTNLDISVSSSDLVLGNNIIEVLATTSANCANYLNNQAVILVNANPLINLTINNSEICNGDTALIVIENSEEEIKYELFIDSELVAEGLGNGSMLGIKVPFGKYSTGINQATVLATNILTACSLEMDAHPDIIVEACRIVVYDGFSPNDDGINETFVIEGLINYPNHKLTIFNRWGNKVYEASPYNNDWDGTNLFGLTVGGKKLPVGTYFYIIELGNGEKPIKGYIYINR